MGFTIGGGSTGSTPGDPRAPQITGGAMTWGSFWGVDASVAAGAQPIAAFFDRESASVLRLVRGTSGTTNVVATNSDAEDCFINVAADQTTLTSSATVVV